MKKIIFISLIFITFTAGVYFFIRLKIFTTSLKYLAQSQLTVAVSKPVKIENLIWLPFNKIILKKIQFDGFNCEETVISINFKKINKGLNSIENITLKNPYIDLRTAERLFKKKIR